jgi:signal transduction histidine kinase
MLLQIIDTEEDPKIIQETLNYMRVNSDDLNETIDNLKELVDIQTDLKPIREHLNLYQYLQKTIVFLSNEFRKHNVSYNFNIPEDETVFYNPAYLESILLNFSTNAVKYSDPKKIPSIKYEFNYEDGYKTLSISDNGLGIDLQKNGHLIFGMYKTFHKHANSRGIGLFMSKNQIEAMGGKVTVESEVGKGTTFKIYFNE